MSLIAALGRSRLWPRTVNGILLCAAATGCSGKPGDRVADAAASATVLPAANFRLKGLALGGGDSLPLDGSTSVAVAGDLLAILQSAEGRVILIDLRDRTYRLLGRRGSGPGDVPPGSPMGSHIALSGTGLVGILDAATGVVRVWDTTGVVRWVRRIGDPSWGPVADMLGAGARIWSDGFGMDSTGRAYVPVGVWEADSVSVMVIRVGPEPGDSAATPRIAAEKRVTVHLPGGRSGHTQPPSEYVRTVGWLWWTVDEEGLVYLARGARLQVDTVRPGGTFGEWFSRTDTADVEVPEAEVARRMRGNSIAGHAITPRDLGPLRYAVVRQLLAAEDAIWIGLRQEPGMRALDLVDRDTRTNRRLMVSRRPAAASRRWMVGWTTGPFGEQWLDVFDLTQPSRETWDPQPLDLARETGPDSGQAGVPVQAPSPPPTTSPLALGVIRFAISCTTAPRRAGEGTVALMFDSSVTGVTDLTIRLGMPRPTGGLSAELVASEGGTVTCTGREGLRFMLRGTLPRALTLDIASDRATVTFSRGSTEIHSPITLEDLTSRTITLQGVPRS